MRMLPFLVAACSLVTAGPALAAPSQSVAALQVALRAQGHYPGAVDGLQGPLTRSGLHALRAQRGVRPERTIGPATRRALGPLGKPLLGQRELWVGAIGWDVSSLEFRLVGFGLPRKAVDGRFTPQTAAALRRFQRARGIDPDGIAGVRTYRALASSAGGSTPTPQPRLVHVVRPGESFFAIGQAYRVSPLMLASENDLHLTTIIVPGQRLTLPAGAVSPGAAVSAPVSREAVRASLDRWSSAYGVDPSLARAVAWMESGFQQHVVSHAGAVGVMQLLPETWAWLDTLLGVTTPRTYDGNIRAGVRYLRWLLDEFGGDTRLALAGYYQGARAVRERGLFDDTKRYVAVVMRLYGTV